MPCAGPYREILNGDSTYYGGSDCGNGGGLEALAGDWMGLPAQLKITLPPLAAIVLQPA